MISDFYDKSKRHYVYTLARPDGRVFYVGKGSGYRIHKHESEVRYNRATNLYKANVIKKIWEGGGEVVKTILAYFNTDEEALIYETALIFFMGGLTNLTEIGERQGGYSHLMETRMKLSDSYYASREFYSLSEEERHRLRELRINLGWTIQKLASEAHVTRQAVSGAEKGLLVRANTVKAIADALSRAYGHEIKPLDIDGLNIL